MKQYSLKTAKGKINELIDGKNRQYKIPNFCINLPYIEKKIYDKEEQHTNKKLKIYLHDVYENKKIEIEITDNLKINDIKNLFAEKSLINLDKVKLRFLYGGTELIDNNHLYQYKIFDGYIIQILKINM